jgi:hypothetical protein
MGNCWADGFVGEIPWRSDAARAHARHGEFAVDRQMSCNQQANREIGPFFGEQPDVA